MDKISFIIYIYIYIYLYIDYLFSSSCASECNVNNCETCYGAEDHCVKYNSGYYVYLEQKKIILIQQKALDALE